MLLDSDIIIYSALSENQYLRDLVKRESPSYSSISLVEVLGFHRLSETEEGFFNEFFAALEEIAISDSIIRGAIKLRQQRKINLGDSLIAATALEHGLSLVTNNVKDFIGVKGLTLIDPLNFK